MPTIAQKVLAAHCGQDRVEPGQLINTRVDLIMANDITAPIAIKEFRRIGLEHVFDPARVVFVPSHFAPAKDIKSADQVKFLRDFAREEGIQFFEIGRMGIEHVILPEMGLVRPGMVVIGADSHTCTYGAVNCFATGMGSTDIAAAMATGEIWMKVPRSMKFVYHGVLSPWVGGKDLILHTIGDIGVDGALYASMEFTGEAISQLSVEGRLTMANMAIEAGGKAGLFQVDDRTRAFLAERTSEPWTAYASDADAEYADVREYDVSRIEPVVACPHLPSDTRPVSAVGEVTIDQAYIGSCTNGRIEDLRLAASVIRGKQVHPYVRLIVVPGSQAVYKQAMQEGLLETFVEAGAAVSTPTCGACLGGHMGVLGAGERAISTTNRNFVGRMGSPKAEVYLANPAVAAASAVAGRIVGPEAIGVAWTGK